jgi:hypothetical protein
MGSERGDMADAARREVEDAKARLSEAAGRMRQEAMSAGSTISSLVYDELDRRSADLSEGLEHIARKMRDATTEGNQEPPRMVQQAVDVIDDLSARLRNRSTREIGEKVAQFGRENPVTFMAACLATGVLAGRFLIAQSEDQGGSGYRASGYGGSGEWGNERYGRPDWTGQPGSKQGDFGYRETSDLDRGDWAAGAAAGSEVGGFNESFEEDAPSDHDLTPDEVGKRGLSEGVEGVSPAPDTQTTPDTPRTGGGMP